MTTNTLQANPLPLTPQTMLPDLLGRHPLARAVFNRYGLRGCGGAQGPAESLEFFAKTHGVPLSQLVDELDEVVRDAHAAQKAERELRDAGAARPIDTIYRPFFTAGIGVVLTAGAAWGALLLWRIGLSGAFTAVSIHDVNAHGHAQIFGWVGLFIMGFAYQAFSRMWHTDLRWPRLAVTTLAMMLAGIVLRSVGMTAAGGGTWAVALAMLGGALEVGAVVIFAVQIVATFRRSGAVFEPYVGFVVAALGWFVVSSVFSVWHTWNTMTATGHDELLWYVATFQAPLRDLQIHGLALFMILGVCLRMLPGLFDAPRIKDRRAWTALGLLLTGVIGETLLFIAYRLTGNHALAAALMAPWLLLAAGILVIALPWRLWRPFTVTDRSGKFVRAAYGWLAISMLMLLLLPVYQWASGIPFSHAYYGAMRHAITVGFISLMIMGFAAKVVPTLNGLDTRTLSPLWGPFLLVNVGCFLRVSMQTLTDWHAGFFAVVGVSGVLEVAGLAWWLLRIIWRAGAQESAAASLGPAPQRIEPTHRVAEVLAWFPQTEPVFEQFGFTAIRNPVLRRTVARHVTLERACAMYGINIEEFTLALNGVLPEPCTTPADESVGGAQPVALTMGGRVVST
jgi:Domain of unknown function (DUF1858)/NnrS protein